MEDKEAAFRYINKYQRENYDRITILVKKGEKEMYKALAQSMNMTTSELFVRAAEMVYGKR